MMYLSLWVGRKNTASHWKWLWPQSSRKINVFQWVNRQPVCRVIFLDSWRNMKLKGVRRRCRCVSKQNQGVQRINLWALGWEAKSLLRVELFRKEIGIYFRILSVGKKVQKWNRDKIDQFEQILRHCGISFVLHQTIHERNFKFRGNFNHLHCPIACGMQ